MKNELIFYIRILINYFKIYTKKNIPLKSISKERLQLLNSIKKAGCSSYPSFLNKHQTTILIKEVDTLLQQSNVKIWKDSLGSDKRIYGANQISDLFLKYYNDPFINTMIDAHEKTINKSGFILAAKMEYKENNAGSGDGWHRDRTDRWQTKSITYLTDVSTDNGPFQYIKYSHNPFYILRDWLRYGIQPSRARISDMEINLLLKREPERLIEFTGNHGTIVFANTQGIHRGKPMREGVRVAITTYFWTDIGIPVHIEKFLQK